ncbi:MAG: glycogen/starch/alpha-glucan phosphorylase [Nitrospirae bacterium]|nr:glycogen/starch/alpha-glucan phosphorylase [Nitrospirota bacterium]
MDKPVQKKPPDDGGPCEDVRSGLGLNTLWRAYVENLICVQGRGIPDIATMNDRYMAFAYTVRDRMMNRAAHALHTYKEKNFKVVCYLSVEFLMGPHLGNNLINLGIYSEVRDALKAAGFDIDQLLEQEEEPGLGNGGLGRLAACYLDSMATLEIPCFGYGIRYEFGIFDQELRDGWQVEKTDKWLRFGNPWEIARPEVVIDVKLGGRTESYLDEQGRYCVRWAPHRIVRGTAYDTPVIGYRVGACNTLRLWKAEATESFDLQAFSHGDYYRAVEDKVVSENVTKVLYPNDEQLQGKHLRLEQQYFFVSCSMQDIIRIHLGRGKSLDTLHETYAVQLNDTHPSIAVAELMRLLIDERLMDWEKAWHITVNTFAYTNHTLLPEALEKWSLQLFGELLPRHLEIIFEINWRFLEDVKRRYPGDEDRVRRMSIIDETGGRFIRMANLACVGSHAINGVAALHTGLLKSTVLRDFYEFSPEKFSNKTNGVTPRRWMVLSNPGLTELITGKIGPGWIKDLNELRRIEEFADDKEFRDEWRSVKFENKKRLAARIKEVTGIIVNPDSLFDMQVKRIHEYKRQHLNVLYIISLYIQIKLNPNVDIVPRTFIFGGKAAPGYFMAKLMIKLITSVAEVINNDPDVRGRLKVVFFPDFNVKNGQRIYPAADLSEQISTAGTEASGTGNMKFAMNGALTIGTLDGANVEIREEVGAENFFLFGLTAKQVQEAKSQGYNPSAFYYSNQQLREVMELIRGGRFSPDNTDLFRPLLDTLMYHDEYMLFADFQSYIDCHARVEAAYRDRENWTRMSILNTARMGKFSSDRAIKEYCRDIWKAEPVVVDMSGNVEWTIQERAASMSKRGVASRQ